MGESLLFWGLKSNQKTLAGDVLEEYKIIFLFPLSFPMARTLVQGQPLIKFPLFWKSPNQQARDGESRLFNQFFTH